MFNTHDEVVAFQRKVEELGATMEQDVRVVRYNSISQGVWWECLDSLQQGAEELAKLCKEVRDSA